MHPNKRLTTRFSLSLREDSITVTQRSLNETRVMLTGRRKEIDRVQQFSQNPRKASFGKQPDAYWNATKLRVADRNARTAVANESALKVLIVDRDSMSSDLLAGALFQGSHELGGFEQ